MDVRLGVPSATVGETDTRVRYRNPLPAPWPSSAYEDLMPPSPNSAARRPAVARIACWSARHSVITVLAWVAVAVAAFFGGKLLGTVSQPQYDPGQSGAAERMLSQLHVVTPDAESVLIAPRHAAPGQTFATDPQLSGGERSAGAGAERGGGKSSCAGLPARSWRRCGRGRGRRRTSGRPAARAAAR